MIINRYDQNHRNMPLSNMNNIIWFVCHDGLKKKKIEPGKTSKKFWGYLFFIPPWPSYLTKQIIWFIKRSYMYNWRCILGYFLDKPLEELPYIKVNIFQYSLLIIIHYLNKFSILKAFCSVSPKKKKIIFQQFDQMMIT